MRITVCIKRIPDTASTLKVTGDGKSIDQSDLAYVASPYDEYAIEEALRLKESAGAQVDLVMLGPESAVDVLRKALAMGADSATLLKAEEPIFDPLVTAKALAAFLKENPADIIMLGKQAVDTDNAQMGQLLAALLDMPCIGNAVNPTVDGSTMQATREIPGGKQTLKAQLPAIFCAEKSDHEPRYAGLKGIMLAKKKEIPVTDAKLEPAKQQVVKLEVPQQHSEGKIVGEGAEAVPELVRLLREEAGVI